MEGKPAPSLFHNAGWALGCPQLATQSLGHEACVWSAEPQRYREFQLAAYKNDEGASFSSVVALMCIYPLIIVLQHLIALVGERHVRSTVVRSLAEFGGGILPLTGTFSAPHLVWASAATFASACACLVALAEDPLVWPRLLMQLRAAFAARRAAAIPTSFSCIDAEGRRLRFVAEYRAVVMITTCIAILAVDFPSIFPRAHAKTSEFGFSLMDLGTGSIICTSAVCSRAARGVRNPPRRGALLQKLFGLWPLLTLGFVRLAVLWGIDYHTPTDEYGVHWNFFFTVAVVALASTAADFGPRAAAVAGAVLLLLYQLFLSLLGGSEFMLRSPRLGLFSANREGILGCAGFLSLHWMAVSLGALVNDAPRSPVPSTKLLLAAACIGLAVAFTLDQIGLRVSRRMCNLPYVVFILSINALVLGLLALLDLQRLGPRPRMPLVLAGVQDSMLVTFLVANLCTGAINVCFQPLLVPSCSAMLIMVSYSCVWALPFSVLAAKGRALRFW